MKYTLSFIAIAILSFTGFSQSHVEWDFSFDSEKKVVLAEAKIEEGWHLYSQNAVNEFGPIPTAFEFVPNDNFELIGSTVEPEPIKEFDPNFEEELFFFEDEVTFEQALKVSDETILEGIVTYMVCNETMCMPPIDVEFRIEVSNEK